MGFLDTLEKRLEGAVSSVFAKVSKAELQPVEVLAAVRNAMDNAANAIDRDRVLVPHTYYIYVATSDFPKLTPALVESVRIELAKHASKQNYRFSGDLTLLPRGDSKLGRAQVRIEALSENPTVLWRPFLVWDGQRFEIPQGTTSVGRDEAAQITIDDRGLSRLHFEIAWNGQVAAIRDLQSTNGTSVDGTRISEAVLRSGSRISAGRNEFEFELLAVSEDK
ncbi:MAG: hypothetical protein RIQ37_787 [Actinomycetota bacterium]